MLLSIGLMVKNESQHLERCLQSLTPILNEISSELIIVDTGSTDNTVEIAQRYTEKVYHHEWFDDFAGMRNIVLGYARGKWFFYLDGDEVVEDPSGIIKFFKSRKYVKYNSAFIDMKNFYNSSDADNYGLFQALRFFANTKNLHFKGIIHEQPQAKGPVTKIEGHIIHYGYVSDDHDLMEYKYRRNITLIKKVLEKEPDNIYHLWQLSQSYSMYGKNKQALETIEKAYELAIDQGLSNYMNVVVQLAKLLLREQRFSECEAICEEGLGLKEGYIDLYYHQAMSQVELGKYVEAIVNFEKFLSLVADYKQGKIITDLTLAHHTVGHSEQVYLTLCAIYRKLGNDELLIEYAHKVENPALVKNAAGYLIDIYIKQGDFYSLKDLYDKWSDDENVTSFIEGIIEDRRTKLEENKKTAVISLFSEVDTTYGLLNIVRKNLDHELVFFDKNWEKIVDLDFKSLELYYGDFLLAGIIGGKSLFEVLRYLHNEKISLFFLYLLRNHKDFLNRLISLFDDKSSWLNDHHDKLEIQRIKVAILYAILQQDKKISDSEYRHVFQMYVDVGIAYLEACYNPQVLEMESASWLRTDADGFLFFMRKTKSVDRHSVEYVRFLRKALAQDETMNRGINQLLEEVQEGLANSEQDELSNLKKSIQDAIKDAINAGEIDTAIALINEYEDAVGIDAPLCSAKGIVAMINGRLKEAESILLTGMELEPDNADLFYNLGFLYETVDKPTKSMEYYALAARHANSSNSLLDDVQEAFTRMSQDIIPRFRKQEFDRRLSRIGDAKKQELVPRKPSDQIHVVYVMTHVGVSGGAKIIFEHANRLEEMGVRVSLVCHFPRPEWFPLRVDYIEVPFEKKLSSGIPECDVIVATYWDHIQECIEASIAPVVYFEQGDSHLFDDTALVPEVREFVCKQYELPQFITTVSRQTANVIKKKFNREASVFPNCVDENIFNYVGRKFTHSKPYIVMIGSMNTTFKGIEDIVDAYSLFKTNISGTDPDVDLIWITPDQPSTVPKAVGRVFVNPPQKQIGELLRGAAMYVSGSYYESFSLPPMEAMACGCPVITTANVGVLEYAVHNSNALLCDIGQPEQLADAMCKLIQDVDLRNKLITDGFLTIQNYKWANIMPQIVAYYEDVSRWTPATRFESSRGKQKSTVNKPKISLVYTSLSGSNTIALYKRMPERISRMFDVALVPQTIDQGFTDEILNSDVVVITEGNYHFRKTDFNPDQIVVDLWHAFPTKNIGYTNRNEPFVETIGGIWKNIDILVSYSHLFNDLMYKCLRVNESKFRILGAPRNDLLLRTDGKANLSNVFGSDLTESNVIFYMPTWRYSARGNTTEGEKHWDNILGMDEFDTEQFDEFLIKNNCFLVAKIHPAEELQVLSRLSNTKNIQVLTNQMLGNCGYDLYEVLNSAAILITDYSSVYIDFLLMDRPIIFTPTDLDKYRQDRGLLLEPYSDWTPGDWALTQHELESAIIRGLEFPELCSNKRESICSIVHHYDDAFSSERVWNLIENMLEVSTL